MTKEEQTRFLLRILFSLMIGHNIYCIYKFNFCVLNSRKSIKVAKMEERVYSFSLEGR